MKSKNKAIVPRAVKNYLLVVGVIIILLGAVYYIVVQLPAKKLAEIELTKIELLRQERQEKEMKLDVCLEKADSKYNDRWNSACERLGRDTGDSGRCGLPSEQAKHYDSEYKNQRDECLTRYK